MHPDGTPGTMTGYLFPSTGINQFGLVASKTGSSYLTVYDTTTCSGQVELSAAGVGWLHWRCDPRDAITIGWVQYSAAMTSTAGDPISGVFAFANNLRSDNWMWSNSPVPEPHEWALIIIGSLVLFWFAWRRPGTGDHPVLINRSNRSASKTKEEVGQRGFVRCDDAIEAPCGSPALQARQGVLGEQVVVGWNASLTIREPVGHQQVSHRRYGLQ